MGSVMPRSVVGLKSLDLAAWPTDGPQRGSKLIQTLWSVWPFLFDPNHWPTTKTMRTESMKRFTSQKYETFYLTNCLRLFIRPTTETNCLNLEFCETQNWDMAAIFV